MSLKGDETLSIPLAGKWAMETDVPSTKKSVFRAPVSSAGFEAMVEAQNRTLTAFGREIAAAIQSLNP